jgi:hypothetical protein
MKCNWVQRFGKHGGTVVYRRRFRDLFSMSFWVVCWGCEETWGPFETREIADGMLHLIDALEEA